MSTFTQLQSRIEDNLNRTDFNSQVQRSIKTAIRHYERRRWSFNETSTALTTSSGQTFISFPSNFLLLDEVRITVNGEHLKLNQRSAAWIREANAASATGQPTDFGIYQNRINLFVIPNSAWSVPTYYIKSLPELSAASDTNSWTTGVMEDLIVHHATKLMWANVLRNDREAAKYAALEQSSLAIATNLEEQFQFGSLQPTQF